MRGLWWNAARAVIAAVCACLMAASCSLSPYRIDIQQGNVVTQEMLAKLKPEMSRSQVKFVLGTPVVVDTFHPDRWDYFYKFDKAGNPREQRVLTLVFTDDKLKQIVGDVKAAPGLVTDAPAPADVKSKP